MMTIDEVKERLRKLIKKWREVRKEYAESQQYGVAQVAEWHADALEKVLTSISAPDDDLREGARELIAQWREHLRRREDDGLLNKSVLIGDCADMLEDLLAKNPDEWWPISKAPLNRTFVELCRWNKATEKEEFIVIVARFNDGVWEERDGYRIIPSSWATHYKPLPAPPREGKG